MFGGQKTKGISKLFFLYTKQSLKKKKDMLI